VTTAHSDAKAYNGEEMEHFILRFLGFRSAALAKKADRNVLETEKYLPGQQCTFIVFEQSYHFNRTSNSGVGQPGRHRKVDLYFHLRYIPDNQSCR